MERRSEAKKIRKKVTIQPVDCPPKEIANHVENFRSSSCTHFLDEDALTGAHFSKLPHVYNNDDDDDDNENDDDDDDDDEWQQQEDAGRDVLAYQRDLSHGRGHWVLVDTEVNGFCKARVRESAPYEIDD
uniref:Uncharacterized protein n=1 Tax=Vespula pensylvanica TaxID=30213 RepID=A0A834PH63_VESPE|nr:hypothetical protein H0235_001948 [Vespula pensylvanica]